MGSRWLLSHSQMVRFLDNVWNRDENVWILDDLKTERSWDTKLDHLKKIITLKIQNDLAFLSVWNLNKMVWISDIFQCLKSEQPFVPMSALSEIWTFGFWHATVLNILNVFVFLWFYISSKLDFILVQLETRWLLGLLHTYMFFGMGFQVLGSFFYCLPWLWKNICNQCK